MTQVVDLHQEVVPRPLAMFPSDAQCQSLPQPWQSMRMDSGSDWRSEAHRLKVSATFIEERQFRNNLL